jgi:hypothetical protein
MAVAEKMRTLHEITENEMILAFIQAEAEAWPARYQGSGLQAEDYGAGANPRDEAQNQRRRSALAQARGYGQDQLLFRGLPNDVTWYRARITVAELGSFRHLNYPTFVELTGGSRLVRDGSKNVGSVQVGEELDERILDLSKAVSKGERHPSLIAVASDPGATPVILEGNKRASAYVRDAPSDEEIEIILGVSPKVSAMHFF